MLPTYARNGFVSVVPDFNPSIPAEQGWASPARQPPLLPDPRCFLGRCLQTPPYPSNSHTPTPPRRSVPCWPSRSPEASCPLLLPTAPTGPLSCVRRELGAPRSSRPRRMPGPASLPAYVSRAARAGGGDWPGLTRGIYPEALVSGGYVSQSDGTAYVCPGCVSRKLALGQPTGILSLATGVAAATASPKTREHSGASGRPQLWVGVCRKAGHGETRVGGPHLARQRNSGRQVGRPRLERRTPLSLLRKKQGTERVLCKICSRACGAVCSRAQWPNPGSARTHIPFVTSRRGAASLDEMRTNWQKIIRS